VNFTQVVHCCRQQDGVSDVFFVDVAFDLGTAESCAVFEGSASNPSRSTTSSKAAGKYADEEDRAAAQCKFCHICVIVYNSCAFELV
jgi:hypothetical protein